MTTYPKIFATETTNPEAIRTVPSNTLREQNDAEREEYGLNAYREERIEKALGPNWKDVWYWKVALDYIDTGVSMCPECGSTVGHNAWCPQA